MRKSRLKYAEYRIESSDPPTEEHLNSSCSVIMYKSQTCEKRR